MPEEIIPNLTDDDSAFVRSMFACGVEEQFTSRFSSLPYQEQRVVYRIARRMHLTIMLRYRYTAQELPSILINEEHLLETEEIPSLEIYLLFTCLDTLAGQNYMKFEDWLDSNTTGEDTYTHSTLLDLYEKYSSRGGITRNLRELFNSLPEATIKWLHLNSIIDLAKRIEFDPSLYEPQVTLKGIFNYFYDYRRNPFTHQGLSRFTDVSNVIGSEPYDYWYVAASFGGKKNIKCLAIRTGLDEATLLRIIVHGSILQRLEIPVSDAIIDRQVAKLTRISAIHSFLLSLKKNKDLLQIWSNLKLDTKDPLARIFVIYGLGLSQLSNKEAYKLHANLGEYNFHAWLAQYCDAVDRLTRSVEKLNVNQENISDPESKLVEARTFMIEAQEWPEYHFVLNALGTIEVSNLKQILADPC